MMDEFDKRIKSKKGDIEVFVTSCPLTDTKQWPSKTILLARDKIYRNEKSDAENIFLAELREQLNDEQDRQFNIIINYSPCVDCADEIKEFLDEHSDVEFEIAFGHVYSILENREGLPMLHGHDRVTLRALRGKDWKELIKLILKGQIWDGWDAACEQLDLSTWDEIRESIKRPDDWEADLQENAETLERQDEISHLLNIVREERNPDQWVVRTGRRFRAWKQHNKAMQLLYNYGRGGLEHVLNGINDDEDREGYAFLLHVLRTLKPNTFWRRDKREREITVKDALRERIVADYVAQKQLDYIVQRQAEGNRAEAAAQAY